jgi:hypothetical protein
MDLALYLFLRGPVPRTPWDFSLWGYNTDSRVLNSAKDPARLLVSQHQMRRSGCVPAEPYPPIWSV